MNKINYDLLKQLEDLLDEDLITQEEFNRKAVNLVSNNTVNYESERKEKKFEDVDKKLKIHLRVCEILSVKLPSVVGNNDA